MIFLKNAIYFILFSIINFNVLHCQTWNEAENIYENSHLGPLELSVSLSSNETFYFVFFQRTKNETEKDTLFYFSKQGSYISDLFFQERNKNIIDISTAANSDEKINLIWGEANDPNDGIVNAYFAQILENELSNASIFQSFENFETKPAHIDLAVLPNNSLLAYWQIDYPSGIWFSYMQNNSWAAPFLPFPDFSENFKAGSAGVSFYPYVISEKNGKVGVTFTGVSSDEIEDHKLLFAENTFINHNWDNTAVSIVTKSKTEFYHMPKLAATSDGLKYVLWVFDKDSNYWPDEVGYAFSNDGVSWSNSKLLTNGIGDFTSDLYIQPDQSEHINIILQHWSSNENGLFQNKYYFARAKRDSFSSFAELSCMNYKHSPHSLNFIVDNNNIAHIFWVEFKNKPISENAKGIVIKHSWNYLPTAVIENKNKKHRDLRRFETIKIHPNPFNLSISIRYQLYLESQFVKFSIFNSLGEKVKILLNANQSKGEYSIVWNGMNNQGNLLPSGIYFFLAEIDGKIAAIKKIIFLK